jgi:hypothetical protein
MTAGICAAKASRRLPGHLCERFHTPGNVHVFIAGVSILSRRTICVQEVLMHMCLLSFLRNALFWSMQRKSGFHAGETNNSWSLSPAYPGMGHSPDLFSVRLRMPLSHQPWVSWRILLKQRIILNDCILGTDYGAPYFASVLFFFFAFCFLIFSLSLSIGVT